MYIQAALGFRASYYSCRNPTYPETNNRLSAFNRMSMNSPLPPVNAFSSPIPGELKLHPVRRTRDSRLSGRLLHPDQLDLEHQRGARREDAPRPALTVGQLGQDDQLGLPADPDQGNALLPALDDPPGSPPCIPPSPRRHASAGSRGRESGYGGTGRGAIGSPSGAGIPLRGTLGARSMVFEMTAKHGRARRFLLLFLRVLPSFAVRISLPSVEMAREAKPERIWPLRGYRATSFPPAPRTRPARRPRPCGAGHSRPGTVHPG